MSNPSLHLQGASPDWFLSYLISDLPSEALYLYIGLFIPLLNISSRLESFHLDGYCPTRLRPFGFLSIDSQTGMPMALPLSPRSPLPRLGLRTAEDGKRHLSAGAPFLGPAALSALFAEALLWPEFRSKVAPLGLGIRILSSANFAYQCPRANARGRKWARVSIALYEGCRVRLVFPRYDITPTRTDALVKQTRPSNWTETPDHQLPAPGQGLWISSKRFMLPPLFRGTAMYKASGPSQTYPLPIVDINIHPPTTANMAYTLYDASVPLLLAGLNSLLNIITKAEEYAKEKSIDAKEILDWKLADDMLPFSFQFFVVADCAIKIVARVQGTEPEALGREFASLDDLRQRVEHTITIVKAADPKTFEARTDALVPLGLGFGKGEVQIKARDYLVAYGMPNFFFHISTAYGILRAKGVQIGKGDYLTPFSAPITQQQGLDRNMIELPQDEMGMSWLYEHLFHFDTSHLELHLPYLSRKGFVS
ncbi:hypothetical protein CCUS01_00342 [Colletotrichum cuscutae]|uniref:Uncharacterized protein n=1 Tax=Colletotrichum cuscutae TaxID=1209917 RepID=A0AAI9YE99_9PEZI|nr:hypothetical protein CCUS01_00342 [Colletotrichum cuscutae]